MDPVEIQKPLQNIVNNYMLTNLTTQKKWTIFQRYTAKGLDICFFFFFSPDQESFQPLFFEIVVLALSLFSFLDPYNVHFILLDAPKVPSFLKIIF